MKQRFRAGDLDLDPAERQALVDLYDAEILYTDAKLGELLAELDRRGLLDRTLVVLLADHGEELLERGGIGHGTSLYEELLHVPLILRLPGGSPEPHRIAAPVSTVDLLPTLAEYFELDAPPGLAGRSLLGLVAGEDALRPIYAEGLHGPRYQHSVRLGEWKYVATVPVRRKESATGSMLPVGDPWFEALERGVAPREELYHLAADPGETRDLSRTRPEELRRLREVLRDVRPRRSAPPTPSRPVDPADAEALRALGYLD
jgi:arylsulfatase A-like enzyme